MSEEAATLAMPQQVSMHAESPFEMRVNQAAGMSESAVKVALTTGECGFLHSYTTGSTVDGPGVRLVIWTAGCQFKCLYCHNPDTWNMMNGMPVTLDRVVEEITKYRRGLKLMSGGVTLSGGEPLMQDRFAVKLFAAVKALGVHTALDTNGFLGERLSDHELDQIDIVLLDIKSWDPQRHERLTGKPVAPTLEFARRLARHRTPISLRYVLVPGYTDDEDDINQLAAFCAELGNVERVDVLPFHQMGRYKWKKLGMTYELDLVDPPSNELVEKVCRQFRVAGLKAY